MKYLAHKCGEKEELLIEHLQQTADLAEMFASSFGSSKVGRQLGLLHDVGKLTIAFQNVLQGKAVKKDHAIVSGIYYNKYGKIEDKWLRKHMALLMACHHSHLYGSKKSLSNILTEDNIINAQFGLVTTRDADKTIAVENSEEWNEIQDYIEQYGLNLNLEASDYLDITDMSVNEKMFYIRMLYSCLVDADYTATAMFEDNEYYNRSMKTFDAEALLTKLNEYHDTLVQAAADTPMNRIRNRVYDVCAKMGPLVGRSICTLTAPTGTGKTLALMKFALENAKELNKNKVIIVLPYLSIIDQNAQLYQKIFGEDVVLIDDSQTDFTDETRLLSERWSAPIIVTTSVKFFETMFESKATDIRRLHQVANSVIVFDECQTLPSSILNMSMEILQSLTRYYNTTVLLSTATKPSYEYRNKEVIKESRVLGNKKSLLSRMMWNGVEIMDDVPGLFKEYEAIKNMSVDTNVATVFDTQMLVDYYKDESQVLYVFNTIKHATDMYECLVAMYGSEYCYLITSNLCANDKLVIIEEINKRLHAGLPVYVAATQCIEAGVDFDFPAGAREYAPFDSVVQAAGRVNRNGKSHGRFLVFLYKDHGRYDYPSEDYKWASDITYDLLKSSSGMNVYDLGLMDKYFKQLFQSVNYRDDKQELYDALYDVDYDNIDEAYTLIEKANRVTMIVVPNKRYDKEQYDKLIDDIVRNNYTITKGLMRQLSKYTVQMYATKLKNINGYRLSFRGLNGGVTNWYLVQQF